MNPSNSQEETLAYFTTHAAEWASQSQVSTSRYSVLFERNEIIRRAIPSATPLSIVDVGCGAGELAEELASNGHQVVGIDFSHSMIALAEQGQKRAHYVCGSVFDWEPKHQVDVIIASGLIEYLDPQELVIFLARCRRWSHEGTRILVHARNRLFNLFSDNEYTTLEKENGTFETLQSVMNTWLQFPTVAEATRSVGKLVSALQPLPRQPMGSIKVSHRLQFLPSELIRLVGAHGFVTEEIHPVHYHVLPPKLMSTELAHTSALWFQRTRPSATALLFQCSSFILQAMLK